MRSDTLGRILSLVVVMLLVACGAGDSGKKKKKKSGPTPRASSGAQADAAAWIVGDIPDMVTQAEADAAAAEQINEANADEEFEKLQKDLSSRK